jgi:RNA polymerase sigma-70 factor (ECF subfamily)
MKDTLTQPTPTPEAALILAAKRGDTQAFDELVTPYIERTKAQMLLITRNAADAEDLTYEALAKAWKNMPSFSGSCKFSTWLHTIAKNNAITWISRAKKKPTVSIDQENEDGLSIADLFLKSSSSDSPSSILSKKEVAERVNGALNTLSTVHRETIIAAYFNRKTSIEISLETGVDEGTVRSRIHYAKNILRKILQ